MADAEVRYEYTTARSVRGMESKTVAKWESNGWELVSQAPGTLRTEMKFRRVKPSDPLDKFGALLAKGWAAFRRLNVRMQLISAAAVVVAVVAGITAAAIAGSRAEDGGATAESAPVASTASPEPAATSLAAVASETPRSSPSPSVDTYVYTGAEYTVAVRDTGVTAAGLTHYWVVTAPMDVSTDACKEAVRLIIADIARLEGSADFKVDVVTDEEIALAEAASTSADFVAEHGQDYAVNEIPAREVEGWLASYTGGFDYNSGAASTQDAAYEVIWRPYATSEIEKWKPEL